MKEILPTGLDPGNRRLEVSHFPLGNNGTRKEKRTGAVERGGVEDRSHDLGGYLFFISVKKKRTVRENKKAF